MTIFNILDNILKNKSYIDLEKHVNDASFNSVYNIFMICRWLSMSNKEVVKVLSENQHLLDRISNKELHYKTLIKLIPRQKSSFLKYIK